MLFMVLPDRSRDVNGDRPALDSGPWLPEWLFMNCLVTRGLACLWMLGPAMAAGPTRESVTDAVLARYAGFSLEEKQAAIAGLATRADSAARLLEAVGAGKIGRGELPSFVARQIADLKDPVLTETLERVWGKVGTNSPGAEEAAKEHARWKALLTPDVLKGANPSQGRVMFKTVCATCHTLFGEGAKTGPDLTGSNRANLDYILENVANPNAVLGKDYEVHIFSLRDGRTVSGMVRKESESAFTVQTLTAEEVVAKKEIVEHLEPGISMMPVGLISALTTEQVRDLMAYLASPVPVAMPGEGPADGTMRVPGAIEGETMRILGKTGAAGPQEMRVFRDSRWSGGSQLWWTGAKPGDQLTLALPVTQPGRYAIKAVFTRAPDYGTARVLLDGQPLSDKQIDFFGSKVTATPLLTLGERDLTAGDHRLTLELTGANPEAVKSYMTGLDYVWLEKK
jgi:putative heme-binding domain-containing protein